MRLYDISQQFISIQELAENDESMIEAVADTMEGIAADFEQKGQAVVVIFKGMEADIEAIDSELKRLSEKKKAIQNRVEWLRNYLRDNMAATGITKISCPLFNITLSEAAKQVEVFDESALPDDYVTVKTVLSPDKRKLLADLKEGVDIPGAMLVEGTRRLTIK